MIDPTTPPAGDSRDGAAPPRAGAPSAKRQRAAGPSLGTAKAVDTMFRNAVRVELDLITLAAMKANIMISLNGLIISALVISGAFVFSATPTFLIPAAVFLLSCAGSIIFALFAASPERADLPGSVLRWVKDVFRRRARLTELNAYVMSGRKNRGQEELNPLIYEDRVQLDPQAHWDRMRTLITDREDIYRKMSDQLHWLGQMANRKFKLLNISYAFFRWGLAATVLVFLLTRGLGLVLPSLDGPATARGQDVAEFVDVYEPSGAAVLPDGRLLVAEDEPQRALSLLSVTRQGTVQEDHAPDVQLIRSLGRKLTDLEGMTTDAAGFVYATTSHSLDKSGHRSPDREQLVRFKVVGRMVGELAAAGSLRDELLASSVPAQVGDLAGASPPKYEALNIEGLAIDPGTGNLLLGLREPVAGNQAIIVPIVNPDDMFAGRPPVFGAPLLVAINGGIRSLAFDPVLEEYLIVNEVIDASGAHSSRLWSWNGSAKSNPVPIDVPNLSGLTNVEAMVSIDVGGEPQLLLMSDEGDPKKNRPARYLFTAYTDLSE